MSSEETDQHWMARALALAERGRGYAEPNPLVGAIVVRDEQVVGEGWHQRFGESHAEVNAFTVAGEAARGSTLYVTLEPCCHHGKTPPCTDAVIQSGIRRVVAAMLDPFPQVAGQGVALLRAAGIDVEVGIMEAEARRLNAPYVQLLATGRPYVHAKWAMTLDGKIATRTGDAKWISNEASRRRVHELRGRMDAIIVGIGTVLADDPLLTARPPGPRTAVRVVLDSQARLPPGCKLAATATDTATLVVTADTVPAARTETLRQLGCTVLAQPADLGRPVVGALLEELGRRRMTNVLVEGGAEVLGSFLDGGAIDEVHVYIAPKVVGGAAARTAVAGKGMARVADAMTLANWQVENLDGDMLLHGWR